MNQETQDLILGASILIPFLVVVFIAGKILSDFKNRRFTRAWAPLVPILKGTITHDGGGAVTSWLTGTYRGRRVSASMVPGRNMYSGESGFTYNSFEIAFLDLPGAQDWAALVKTPPLGQARWHIAADDKALEERLRAAGVIALVERLGAPKVTYQRREDRLLFSEDAGPLWVPTPERFQEELEVLLRVVEIQEKVNPPHAS